MILVFYEENYFASTDNLSQKEVKWSIAVMQLKYNVFHNAWYNPLFNACKNSVAIEIQINY